MLPYVCIANPGSKRWECYHRELLAYGHAPKVVLVPWAEIIAADGNLDRFPAFDTPAIVRLESPGKDTVVSRLLLGAGANERPNEPTIDWQWEPLPKGWLARPGLQHAGFRRILRNLQLQFSTRPHLHPTACPNAIAAMFDKTATTQRLRTNGVPVPDWLPIAHQSASPLLDDIRKTNWPTTYAKLNTGSSASGIVALYRDDNWTADTSMTVKNGQFYNTRSIRRLRGENEIRPALEFLLQEGLFVQRGIPLAQIDDQNFDVRVVCIYGKPVATIFRLSSAPMTNLHLGGRRGDWASCRSQIPTRIWLDALDSCSNAAECFDSAIAGVDLVFEQNSPNHRILEVNAFGDFFPGWTDANGWSIPRHEIAATLKQLGM